MTESEIFKLIKDYFISIGITSGLQIFSGDLFEKGIYFKLPNVCTFSRCTRKEAKGIEEDIESENASGKTSKQSHIHITGDKMEIFFTRQEIEANVGIDYSPCDVVLSEANIKNLNDLSFFEDNLDLIQAITHIKLAIRKNENPQVQLGKKKEDSFAFNKLRNGLYKDDLLIVLKYRNAKKLFIMGIPLEFYRSIIGDIQKTSLIVFSFTPESIIDDALYQMDVFKADVSNIELSYSPTPFDTKDINSSTSYRPKTNPSLAKKVIAKKEFKCEMSSDENPHFSFISLSGDPYIEAHHLIPVCKQPLFINKLDTPANIVPLCPNCHRKIHNARKKDVKEMVEKIYETRSELLKQSGIEITLEELLTFYE